MGPKPSMDTETSQSGTNMKLARTNQWVLEEWYENTCMKTHDPFPFIVLILSNTIRILIKPAF